MSELRQALLYSFAPYRFGFCGPQDKKSIILVSDYLSYKEVDERKIRNILERFTGVSSYCRLIAKSNYIEDKFNSRVLEAYWLGNTLLDKVRLADIKKLILDDFTKPNLWSKQKALATTRGIPRGVVPHHSFHVLYIGSVTGTVVLQGKLLDFCRISWGRVKRIKSQDTKKIDTKIIVEYQPLVAKSKKIYLGEKQDKEIIWNHKFLPGLKVGDNVSFHWNFACGILNKRQRVNIEKYTRRNIELFNKF